MLHAVTKHGHTDDHPQLQEIAIAPLLCRLYDTIMDNRVRCWYVPNAEQSGFRPKHGCLLPLFSSKARRFTTPIFVNKTNSFLQRTSAKSICRLFRF